MKSPWAILTISLAAQALAQSPCYNLGVSAPVRTTYVQCPNSTMCCRTNHDPATVDTCAPSGELGGLCISKYQEIWRESCTDETWESGGCVKLCMRTFGMKNPETCRKKIKLTYTSINEGNETINRANDDYRITRCSGDDSVCCGPPGSTAIAAMKAAECFLTSSKSCQQSYCLHNLQLRLRRQQLQVPLRLLLRLRQRLHQVLEPISGKLLEVSSAGLQALLVSHLQCGYF